MKYFWGYVIVSIFVLLLSSYIVTISRVEEYIEAFSSEDQPSYSDKSFVEYHMSEDQIRLSHEHELKVMHVIGKNGELEEIEVEPTQNFPIYYTPGLFTYGPRPYVPDYEDAIKLSEIKSSLKQDIDPLKWSWSADTLKQPEVYNYGKPVDLKPIKMEDIPTSGILPTSYYILNKLKTLDKIQMGFIPDGFYIYDDMNMARIPPGFQTSVDRTYIFRK